MERGRCRTFGSGIRSTPESLSTLRMYGPLRSSTGTSHRNCQPALPACVGEVAPELKGVAGVHQHGIPAAH